MQAETLVIQDLKTGVTRADQERCRLLAALLQWTKLLGVVELAWRAWRAALESLES